MEHDEFAEYVAYVGMTKNLKGFGMLIGGIGPRSVGKFMKGTNRVPAEIADLVRDLVHRRIRTAEHAAPAEEPEQAKKAPAKLPTAFNAPKPEPSKKTTTSGQKRKLRFVFEVYEIMEE
ncbi:hypothetical protein KKA69_05660 [Patescibacteria group bacterium]|nr:hypothetical protein [Patescibacteria group bacterium]